MMGKVKYTPGRDLREGLRHVSGKLILDAKGLYDMLQTDGPPKPEEKRVALGVASVKAALEDDAKLSLHWCPSAWQLADSMTKDMRHHVALEFSLQHGGLSLSGTVLEQHLKEWRREMGAFHEIADARRQ